MGNANQVTATMLAESQIGSHLYNTTTKPSFTTMHHEITPPCTPPRPTDKKVSKKESTNTIQSEVRYITGLR